MSCSSRCNRECRLRAGDIALPTTQSRKSTICTGHSSSRAAAALYAPQSSVTIYATLRYLVRNNNNPNVVGVLMRTACFFSFCSHVGNDTSSVRHGHSIVPPSPRPRGGRAQGREEDTARREAKASGKSQYGTRETIHQDFDPLRRRDGRGSQYAMPEVSEKSCTTRAHVWSSTSLRFGACPTNLKESRSSLAGPSRCLHRDLDGMAPCILDKPRKPKLKSQSFE